ncbi:Glycosyltransferase family 61 protein [Dorcoceras hygrometricum]|uniref:Glycosyltransferase family 61 protein n=1 Tax=Dorcoceras hygrometricum TaxID=472368 RepID=A0A2Z7AZY9_9LAMI|nr:Glycosyltransferase family 61 protein [Dorcoceras hygrometricum]
MEKEPKRMIFGATPIILLLSIPLVCVGIDFFWGNNIPFDRWRRYFSGIEQSSLSKKIINETAHDQELMRFHLSRLVRGEDRRQLESTGFACDRTIHSVVCVANQPVKIDTRNMTIYTKSAPNRIQETVIQPHARQEDIPPGITPVHVLQIGNSTPPACEFEHDAPALVFSSGAMGNVFHEMNEIIIPLFITAKQFESRVVLVLEDYTPKFMSKYGKVLSGLTRYHVLNPALNRSLHCFPGSVIGLRYHDNLALNSSEIPGGYSMSGFRDFLRKAYSLKFSHVSQIPKPRLMLLSRTNTRRFLNEDEMIQLIKDVGFELILVKRSKIVSNTNRFVQMINSCSVLVGAHGAGLTNEIFLPNGAVMIQVELLGTEWGSNTYYGDTARAMGVRYLRYKIEPEESSLARVYGRDDEVFTDQSSLFRKGGYRAARIVYLDMQNVRVNLVRFRQTLVEALSLVTDSDLRR